MSTLEILEAHLFVPGGFVDPGNHCSCGNYYNNEYVAGKIQLDEHLAHVAQVLEQHERERCYEAWREGVAVFDPDAVDIMEAANPYRPTKEPSDGRE